MGRSTGCVGQTCLLVGSLDLFSACSAGGLAAGAPRRATPCRGYFFVLPKGMPRPAPFGGPAGHFALCGELPPQQSVLLDLPRTCPFPQLSRLMRLRLKFSDVAEHGSNPQARRTALVGALAVGLAALDDFAQQLGRVVQVLLGFVGVLNEPLLTSSPPKERGFLQLDGDVPPRECSGPR